MGLHRPSSSRGPTVCPCQLHTVYITTATPLQERQVSEPKRDITQPAIALLTLKPLCLIQGAQGAFRPMAQLEVRMQCKLLNFSCSCLLLMVTHHSQPAVSSAERPVSFGYKLRGPAAPRPHLGLDPQKLIPRAQSSTCTLGQTA